MLLFRKQRMYQVKSAAKNCAVINRICDFNKGTPSRLDGREKRIPKTRSNIKSDQKRN